MTAYTLPAPDAPAEDWGRLAVAIPDWRWMPGMAIGGEVSPRHCRVGDHWHMRSAMLDPRREYAWPDPDDPATEGCLLRLLGMRADAVWYDPEFTSAGNWLMSLDGDGCDVFANLGRACIAAAAALGRWPGCAGDKGHIMEDQNRPVGSTLLRAGGADG